MIEYTKLFTLLKERNMKKTDLLEIISPQTLAKLGKNAIVKSDILDKVCLFLNVQPNDIMEVYTYKEIDGQKIKIKCRDIENIGDDISYGRTTSGAMGLTLSDLKKVLDKDGTINVKKLDDIISQMENK